MKLSEADYFEQCYQHTLGLAADSTSPMMLSALGALQSSGSRGRKGEKILYTSLLSIHSGRNSRHICG